MDRIEQVVGSVRGNKWKKQTFEGSSLIFGYVVQNVKLNRLRPGAKKSDRAMTSL